MNVSAGGREFDPPEGPDEESTTPIFRPTDADDEATRILPLRSTRLPMAPVIGTAPQVGAPPIAEPAADDRTVFLPSGTKAAEGPAFDPAVGWLVIVEGPGRGNHCPIYFGQNSVGRAEGHRIRLNFGDPRITRDAHAFIIYDDVGRKFYVRDNGKANLIRVNNAPVMVPTEIKDRDRIQLGETILVFVPFCGPDFDWLSGSDGPSSATRT